VARPSDVSTDRRDVRTPEPPSSLRGGELNDVKLACLALLDAWRTAERELDETRPDATTWPVAAARFEAARDAYTRAFLAIAAQEQVEPDAAAGELL
jgi:hypothetical protein